MYQDSAHVILEPKLVKYDAWWRRDAQSHAGSSMMTSRTARKKRRHSASVGNIMGVMRRMSPKIGGRQNERHATLPTKHDTTYYARVKRHLFCDLLLTCWQLTRQYSDIPDVMIKYMDQRDTLTHNICSWAATGSWRSLHVSVRL